MYSFGLLIQQRQSEIESAIIRDFIDGQDSSLRGFLIGQRDAGRLRISVDLLRNTITLDHDTTRWAALTAKQVAGQYRPEGYSILVTVDGCAVCVH